MENKAFHSCLQGYHFAKPMPRECFERWLVQHNKN